MPDLRSLARLPVAGARLIGHALTAGFDGLVGPVGRMNARIEAHLHDRTRLLRAHYAERTNRGAAPLPVLDAPIDLALRGGIPPRN